MGEQLLQSAESFFLVLLPLILLTLSSQTEDDNRQFLKLYDPDLGQPLPERTYAYVDLT